MPSKFWYVNLYELVREYGGPEEGGWYYDAGYPIYGTLIRTTSEGLAHLIANYLRENVYPDHHYRSSVRPQGVDMDVRVENHPAKEFPAERPHYE